MGRPSKFSADYKPSPPVEPLRKLTEGLLGAEMKKWPNKVVITFDERRDATIVHKTLSALQDCYTAPRE